ncbi:hypothetical protein BKA62DRAFT_767470 [Auriculariales sp. MPI-PUGE-AT-0066]|nr:hypothetical protein BKA62DRAFT_767470 [Auriculariales sp. MPI-PUGE-AT-0066]
MYHGWRSFFLIFLWLLACVLLALAAVRLHYTLNLPRGDPLNGGKNFFDPIVIELIAVSGLAIIWIPWIFHIIHKRREGRRRYNYTHLVIGLSILFLAFLAGAIISTHYWGDISYCWQYRQCRMLTAMLGVAWSATIISLILLVMELHYVSRHRAWGHPMHGRYDPSKFNISNYLPGRRRY